MKISKKQKEMNKHKVNATLHMQNSINDFDTKLKAISAAVKNLEGVMNGFNKGLNNVKKDVWD